ncbi:MAG: O-antigen ligase family protein [Candidatus Bilamarchaeaceae archaeon]
MYKSFEILVCTLILGTAIITKYFYKKPFALIKLAIIFYIIVISIILIEAIIMPDKAWLYKDGTSIKLLAGFYPLINPNTVGYLGGAPALFVFPFLIIEKRTKMRCGYLIIFISGLLVTFFSYSRASIIALPFTILICLLLLKKYRTFLISLVLFSILVVTKFDSLQEFLKRGQRVENIIQLSTPRVELWKMAYEIGKKEFIIGNGYGAGFRYNDWTDTGHAHSSIFEIFYNAGLLGLFVWLLMILKLLIFLFYFHFKNKIQKPFNVLHISIIGINIYMFFRTFFNSYYVYLDYSFLILAGTILYCEIVKRNNYIY